MSSVSKTQNKKQSRKCKLVLRSLIFSILPTSNVSCVEIKTPTLTIMKDKLSLIKNVEGIKFCGPKRITCIEDLVELKVYECNDDIVIGNAIVKRTKPSGALGDDKKEYTYQAIKDAFRDFAGGNVLEEYNSARESFIKHAKL